MKDEGIRAIEKHGLYKISGDKEIMEKMDTLLANFVKNNRMKLPSDIPYTPMLRDRKINAKQTNDTLPPFLDNWREVLIRTRK